MEESFHNIHLPEEKGEKLHGDFVESVLSRIAESTQHLDHQINIVMGISVATFILSESAFEKEHGSIALFFIMIFAGASAVFGLLAVHPPRFMRKRGQSESLLYRKNIESFDSPEAYEKAIRKVMTSEKKTSEQYAIEIYNLCKYYYSPKRKLFHISRKLLILGITLSLLTFVFHFLSDTSIVEAFLK
jgi:hypothetical protein